jgi:hypothetical protein
VVQLMKNFFLHVNQSLLLTRARFGFLPTINVNVSVFCDVILCGLVDTDVSGKYSTSLSDMISRLHCSYIPGTRQSKSQSCVHKIPPQVDCGLYESSATLSQYFLQGPRPYYPRIHTTVVSSLRICERNTACLYHPSLFIGTQ